MFSSFAGLVFAIIVSVIFIAVPTVNHVRMFLAIRRHNNLVAGAAAWQQLSAVLRREKKVALDMALISLVLLLSLAPMPLSKIMQSLLPKTYSVLQPWTVTMVFLISSLNPFLYMLRNKALRDGMKSVFFV